MRLHILGICGTFMGGLALLARELGHEVQGSDGNVYPPMSGLLAAQGIRVLEGYSAAQLQPAPDLVVVGNALSRGNPCVEYLLEADLPFVSGPEWLAREVLRGRHVLAVSGTHGKTTASAMLAWVLEQAGRRPGFLVGGLPLDFGVSARLGSAPYFVLEADEYDSAFFDKRSKFVHYRPRTLVINNIEFDHADIFADLEAIRRQFHHLIRTLPASGRILYREGDAEIRRVLELGCWTPRESFGIGAGDWSARLLAPDGAHFELRHGDAVVGTVQWGLLGRHNVENALGVVAAAAAIGVEPGQACAALARFRGAARRLQHLGAPHGIEVYDDFAHHPTAIAATLAALRGRAGGARILAVFEPRSNSMRMGAHGAQLPAAFAGAELVFMFLPPGMDWQAPAAEEAGWQFASTVEDLVERLAAAARPGDYILIMSNGGFGGLQRRLLERLAA